MSDTGLLKSQSRPAQASQRFKAVVASYQEAGPGLRVIKLAVEGEFFWKAGQYVWLGLGSLEPRAYSIANAPRADKEGGTLEIHIKDTEAKGASSYAVNTLKSGDVVTVSPAAGTSFYNPLIHEDRPILLIAGGMGIAPMKAVAEEALAANKAGQEITLYWGGRRKEDLYCHDYFTALKAAHQDFYYIAVTGELVGEVATRDFEDLSAFSIFLSGPSAMIEATLPLLLERGAVAKNIFYDQL